MSDKSASNPSYFTPSTFCSEASVAVDEQLAGTAASVSYWVALEVAGNWGAQAIADSSLPQAVKEQLFRWQEEIDGLRVQFIKKRDRRQPDDITLLAAAVEPEPSLYRLQLADYEALLSVDPVQLARGQGHYDSFVEREPHYLVCTNGRRDRCCAKFGLPLFKALAAVAPATTWQTTHIGGHRFAATMVALPSGVTLGRVHPDEAADVVAALRSNRLHRLDRVRGLSAYPTIVQAADIFARQQINDLELGNLHLIEFEPLSETKWRVRFSDRKEREIGMSIEELPSGHIIPASCGKQKAAAQTRLAVGDFSIAHIG